MTNVAYPRAVVTRAREDSWWVGIGADGKPEWRSMRAWEVRLFASPDYLAHTIPMLGHELSDADTPEQVFQDHEHAIRWASEVITAVRVAS